MLKKFLVFIFISFLLAGCTSDKIDISMNNGNVRAIRDYEGTIVELPEKPKRILTLSLGFDVMTLGLVPPDRLVAVHKTAPDPGISWIVEESRQIPVKLYFYPFETVLKLKPDLIIASTWTKPEMIQGYRDLGFSVIVCKGPDTVDEVKKTIKKDQPSRLHARRQMNKVLYTVTDNTGKKKDTKKVDLTNKLFDEIAPKYADRKGGYTRIVKIGQRKGDAAMEVLLELV
mgnify:CR=1 FL=1